VTRLRVTPSPALRGHRVAVDRPWGAGLLQPGWLAATGLATGGECCCAGQHVGVKRAGKRWLLCSFNTPTGVTVIEVIYQPTTSKLSYLQVFPESQKKIVMVYQHDDDSIPKPKPICYLDTQTSKPASVRLCLSKPCNKERRLGSRFSLAILIVFDDRWTCL
jgi:hypothetical protein